MPLKKNPIVHNRGKYKGIMFIRGIPDEIKHQFKAYCARRGHTMTGWITKQIKDALKKDGIHRQP